MRLLFFDDYKLGAMRDDVIVDLSPAVAYVERVHPQDVLRAVIAQFDDFRPRFEELMADGVGIPFDTVEIRPPVPRPVNIDCMAVNYMEDGTLTEKPTINGFHKSPLAIIGHGGTMVLQDIPAGIFEGEAELALVIAKAGSDIPAAEAFDHIFGYMNFIDGSARNMPSPNNSFYQVKSRATFAPIGPFLVTKDEVGDAQALDVKLWNNGTLMQSFNTSDMAHDIARCVEFVSAQHPLEVGDVIATGTNHRGLNPFMDGDRVELEITGLGRLRISVRDDLHRTWERKTRLQHKEEGGEGPFTSQRSGKYAPDA